jgi:hypothetical protein
VARIRALPEVTAAHLRAAATQLGGRMTEGQQQFSQASGRVRLWYLLLALRALRADLAELAEGGLAPAVALGQALRPGRLLAVAIAALATPFLLAGGLALLAAGVTLA